MTGTPILGNLHIPVWHDGVFDLVGVHGFQSAKYGFGTFDGSTLTHYAYGQTQIQNNIALSLSARVKSHARIS